MDLTQELRFRWQIHGSIVQVPPTGWSKSLGSVLSSWYSAIDNYIASNGGSTSTTSQQHRAGPKARTESWAMFRKDHVRTLVASSKDTAFVRTLVRASFRVHVRLAGDLCLVGMHMLRVVKFKVIAVTLPTWTLSFYSSTEQVLDRSRRWSLGQNQRSLHDLGGWWVSRPPSKWLPHTTVLARLPWHLSS